MSDASHNNDALSAEKRKLFELLLKKRGVAAPKAQGIPRRSGSGPCALSFAQQRLWFVDRLQPASPAYNVPYALRLTGDLDVAALERSLQGVVARHEVLRTTFSMDDGQPVQVIAPTLTLTLPTIDLSARPATDREAEAQRLLLAEIRRPFDLQRGPLIRATLLHLDAHTALLVLTLHHIVADAWSLNVFMRELSTFYTAYRGRGPQIGGEPQLPELPIQYADYAVWQRESLQGVALDKELDYWRTRLAGVPTLSLPTDHARPPVPTFRGARQEFALSPALSEGLQALSRQSGATLFMTLLAAWQVLLSRYSGQDDIVVGTPVANRTRAEVEPLIGFFINMLPIRTELAGATMFRDVLGRVRDGALEAFAHQEVPFERVVEAVQSGRDLSRHPIFQAMFVLQNATMAPPTLPGVDVAVLPIEYDTVKFDLILSVEETAAGLSGIIGYSSDLFAAETITRLVQHFQTLLAGIVAEPDAPLHMLPLLTPAEATNLRAWQATTAAYSTDMCVPQLFEAQAARRPEAVALRFEDQQLTYSELNARANQLAHHLQALGVAPESRVGLFLERSLDLVVGLLGIWKAGGAYVPIDPAYPQERIQFMLEDSQVAVLVTQERLLGSLPEHPAQLVRLDTDAATLAQMSSGDPVVRITPSSLAYLIYTSGTTGRPKAVLVEHRNLLNVLHASQTTFGYQATDVQPWIASVAFDIALFELLNPLLAGGTTVVMAQHQALDGIRLLDGLSQWTMLHAVPSLLRQIVQTVTATPESAVPQLRRIYVGGDAVPPELLADTQAAFPDAEIVVLYGPTEGTIICTAYRVPRDRRPTRQLIGAPLPNMLVRLYDAHGQLVPLGVAGELYLGGAGVTRGYLNRPDLTAEKFVAIDGERWYRTGDLVRALPDGVLEFLGRTDAQVKIRGYRIEVGEVETVLGQHVAVRESVVMAREDVPGDKRLVAYVVPDPEQPPTVTDLRRFLGSALPEYMVPASFVMLGALPLTPNGKVDRRALPAPDLARPDLDKAFVAPQTPLEQLLAELWQAVLGLPAVGVHDNFFELGGNSIQAAIFVNKLQESLGEVVYVVAVFDAPTIADLADYLLKHNARAAARILGTEAPAEITHAAEPEAAPKVDAAMLARMREVITPLPPRPAQLARPKNPRAIFLLSPPRSGSTLLRVMLAGNPQLFAPPELELLSFNTLGERKSAFAGRDRFWLEGTVRAIMAIKGCDAPTAERIMADCEAQGLTVQAFYALMQEWLDERLLVDKTPSYALDLNILKRMEEDFESPLYIHLLRHPYGMIRSFEDAKLDQVFFRHPHDFPTRTLAELIWTVCQQNIREFLAEIPAERQFSLRFEDLTAQPEAVLQDLCRFLGLSFYPEMAQPYQDKKQRMTDGIHAMSKMVGDVKFHQHKSVDASISQRWKEHYKQDFLGDLTWQLAESLSYRRPEPEPASSSALMPIQALPRDGSTPLPLSFAQQRLWFIDQLQPDSIAYNVPLAFRLTGALDLPALERSINTIVARHEALRTTFPTQAGQPSQVIAPVLQVPLQVIDLQQHPAAERESITRQLITAEARTRFDLATGPLLRTTVLRIDPQQHVLVLNLHHIVSDGWSMSVFMRELSALYDAALRGEPDAHGLPALSIQYADYAGWQQEWLAQQTPGSSIMAQLDYWKQQLADVPVLNLPTDRPRPALPSNEGGRQSFTLPASVSQALIALSRREGVTPFMTLLAAWQVLLSRYSNQTDITVGIPSANRTRAETEGLIGYFVNTQVVRADLSGNPTFRDVLGQVRAVVLQAFAHQDVPFEQVVDAVQPVRDLSHNPLFQVMFALQNAPMAPLRLTNVAVQTLEVAYGTAKFDLSLDLLETESGLAGALEYSKDLFDAPTIRRLVEHFTTLLVGIATNPEQHIAALPLLTAAERSQVLTAWNPPATAYPRERLVHELVAAHAAHTPDAIAVVFGEDRCTYGELNARANQLAHHLQSLGVDVGTPVGICLERSLPFVVGVLAILKAGGAYVPLDPSYPPERIQFMLEDTAAPVVITTAALAQTLPSHAGQLICLDTDAAVLAAQPTTNPVSQATGEDLAYLIYTSGSTGQPKGIGIPHRAITRLVCDTNYVQLTGEDNIALVSNISFDAATFELWGALIHGARLIGMPREVALSPEALAAHIRQHRIDTMFMTTALFNQIAREAPHAFATMREVMFGGEASDPRAVAEVLAAGGPQRLLHVYGPTESTTFASWYAVTEVAQGATTIPIGYPLANTQLYVLDAALQPVPVGVPGELYIGGDGLAQGYLNRPALTAEKFIPDPFGAAPGGRLYRTGDLVRYGADGAIAFVGRIDQQVKLRGFRIELGEIEAALSQHPAVGEVVVVVREDLPGVKRLVAYVVENKEPRTKNLEPESYTETAIPPRLPQRERGAGGEGLASSELRNFLQSKLPEYMVPSAFVVLPALPLTPNGKINRAALPAPEPGRAADDDTYAAPETAAETTLARIWAEVLRLERVGIHDNFFALGGDSILSIQIIARANQAGLRLSPTQLFQHQTIATLAAVADTRPVVVAEQGLVTGAVPLTPIQHWLLARQLPELHHFNQSVLLEASERLDPARLAQAIQYLLLHHDALRLRFTETEAGWQQSSVGLVDPPVVATIDLSAYEPERQAAVLEAEALAVQASLDLRAGPLLRAALIERGADQAQQVLVVVHHLAVDWVSWTILLEDLETAYGQLAQGVPVTLPPKTTAFGQWATRLHAYAQSEAVVAELPSWQAVVAAVLPALPVDTPEGANTIATLQHVTVQLGREETTALLGAAPQAYRAQAQDLLLTALVEAVGAWSGERRVRLELEGHGREDLFAEVDLSRTVGWFTALYPVLLDLRDTETPGHALMAIKEQLRAVPQHGLGYGLLRYLSTDERAQALGGSSSAEVGFNYLGQGTQRRAAEGRFRRLAETVGSDVSARTVRPHRLDVTARVVDGVLDVRWSYSGAQYHARTIAALAERYLDTLRALIAHCLRPEAGGWTPADVPLARLAQTTLDRIVGSGRAVADLYPLTALQQGMLFHTLADAGTGVYVEQLVSTLRGPLGLAAFQAAWDQVVARHAVFRTRFVWAGLDQPLQVVQTEVPLPWRVEDWRALPVDEHEARFAAFLHADRRQGFIVTDAPLLRLTLLRVAEDAHYFVWTVHHLLFDGWSLPLVLNEVFATYEALLTGRALQYAPPRPYRDYIAWLQQQDLAQAEAFWRRTLAGLTAPTPLGVDRVISSEHAAVGYARERHHLSAATTAALNALARQHGLTLNTVVQGAWALLLSRYSGERDVLFGATVSGRPAELTGVERMVGLFINTLPVRVHVTPDVPLVGWLTEIQIQQAEQRQYEYSPLVQVQSWSEIPRGQSLFDSLVVFENYPAIAATAQSAEHGSLMLTDRRGTEQSNYPLTIAVGPQAELDLLITYDRQRFEAATIRRVLGHLDTILTGMATNPGQLLADVPLLTAAEQQQILEWNATTQPYAQDRLVHDLIAQQAARSPESIALVCGEECTTYAGLDAHANQLAHHLQSLGVGPETRVALFLERSLDLVVALLAVWKAGAAYVPIDPSYPQERVSFILQDSHTDVLLTAEGLLDRLPAHAAQVVCLDRDAAQIQLQPYTAPLCAAQLDNLAYLIYTSGTTGTPKAVAVEHSQLLQVLHASQMTFGYQERDIQPWIASVAFDIAAFELFNPLLAGGTVVIQTQEQVLDLPQLVADLQGWTLLHAVPSLLREIVAQARQIGTPEAFTRLRRIWVGGDAVPPELLADTLAVFPAAELVVLYGPTEGTIICACQVVDPQHVPTRQLIGRPLPNAQLRLYDADEQLVPVGVAGEIYIGGGSVTRGYLNRPALTAEKFVTIDGQRWYRTGDLARCLPDGTLEFLGRTDAQVKIRGFRIEVGEVEAVLVQHPAVREVVVLARVDNGRDPRLVAYVVPETETAPTTEELRQFLGTKLPAYMVPSAFVVLDTFPLTPNGKVDRKALPAPERLHADPTATYAAPETAAETTLARIWAEVLRLERVGIHDNFFALGGDSILSIQIVARASQAGLRLTPRQLFESQTIAALAAVVDTAPVVVAEQGLVTGTAPLTPIQQHFFARALPEPHHFNQSMLLEASERLDPARLAQAIQYLLLHHDALRLRFAESEAGWQQAHAGLESRAVWSVIDLTAIAPAEQAQALAAQANEIQASLDLRAGPLLRAALIERGAEQAQQVLVVVHHLAVDWVSWTILLEDLETAYGQLTQGVPVTLPPKTTAFGQWATRLHAYAQSEAVVAELPSWQAVVAAVLPALPVDHPEGANTIATLQHVTVQLGREETTALLGAAPQAYRAQAQDLLLTALVEAVGAWSGERRVRLELEGHGREDLFAEVDLSRTVGWFTALYPVLLDLRATETPGHALMAIKEQLRAVSQHGLGYGLLRYLSTDERAQALGGSRSAEVGFNYLGQGTQRRAAGGRFRRLAETVGSDVSARTVRPHRLDVTARVVDGVLDVRWSYSGAQYHARTIAALAERYLDTLRALIAHCLRPEAGGWTPADVPLARLAQTTLDRIVGSGRAVADLYPLTALQQGMLFHTLADAGTGVYVEQLVSTLRGPLGLAAFQAAWDQVVARHAVFRTRFVWAGLDQPLQLVQAHATVPWRVEDWRALPVDEHEARFAAFLHADRHQGIDPAQAPLMRLALFQVADEVYRFVWTQHHLLLDGWSLPLVLNEVFTTYEALVAGQELQRTPPRPYRDYIAWLQQQDLAQAEAFWRRTLAGLTAPTPLGVDRTAEEGITSSRYVEQRRQLAPETTAALNALARQHGLTLNTVVQGAWALLLSRYSGERDVLFGATVSGRPAELTGVERMVGLFINTVPVRVTVAPDAVLFAWLTEIQAQQAELRQYEWSPLVEVQGWSEIPRGQSLFDSLVIFENYPIQDAVVARREASLRMEHARGVEQSNYPLNIAVVPSAELELMISYDSARFDDPAITRMLGHLQTLLSSMAADPGQRIADLPLLTAAEEQQLEAWNATAQPYPQERLVHELVAQQAARTPEATALVCGAGTRERVQLSYAALDGRANQLAHHLQSLGVGPETRVALFLERSLDLVVALLAVLKAGGAYVPIDPSYPTERVAFILDDAQPVVVLTELHLEATLPASGAQLVRLDADVAAIAVQPATPPVSRVDLANLAYLIYTSGTTGTPKAVLVEHGQLLQVLHASQTTFGYRLTDVQPWLASVAFDIAAFELFNPLLVGGMVVIQTPAQILDLPQLVADLQGWTLLHAVPSLLRQIVNQARQTTTPNAYAGLRRIWVGGDAVPPELLADTLAVFPQAELVVLYGPTEGTIICACQVVDPQHVPTRQLIGRPLPNAQLRLYDAHGQLVPIGVAGEIYIGGGSVTRGYLNRPELTAEKFVTIDNQRWYRTGDRARYLADGTLEFLGRTDSQVKIRGYRIEVGEVEAVLAQHPALREVVVLVRTDVPGDVRMVAYVVPQPEQIAGLGDLRDFLLNKLPAYMVPSAFVVLPALPLTPHGKVDRKALPAPEQTDAEQDDRYVAPRTPIEDVLASIWADVLRRERVGVQDSFFDLGGHSLLATQLISRVREAFQVELPLRSLFELPTVEGLAQQIVIARQDMPGALAPALAPVGRDHALPLSFAQQRLWFLNQLDPSSSADNMPGALRLTGALDRAALEHSLNEIVRRHETLRTTFVTEQGLPVQVIAPAAPVEIALIDLHGLAEADRDAAVLEFATAEARRPFDLQRGPLLRAILLTLGADEHVLLLTLHHIIADGWSWGVLFRELSALYAAHTAGATAALPELPIQYADYAVWQRDWLQGDVLETQLNYWRQQLAGLEPLQLPTDHPRPPVPSAKGSSHSFTLSRSLTDALLDLSRREGVTLFMTLLASWQLLLSRYSGQDDIAVGTPIANRTRGETEDLIGCFINMLVLRTDLTGPLPSGCTFREVLARVRETALGAYAHQDLPFEEVVDALQPARDLSRHPLFQVMFALQNVSMALPSFPGLTTSALSIDFGTAKLDLSLAMAETSAGLSGALEYSTDLFTAATIERMVAHFELLLTSVVADAGRRVTHLPILLDAERQLLLEAWNATAEPYTRDRLVHELVAQQAARTPEATAVVWGSDRLSYAALDERANQLAQHLRGLGVEPETRVALFLDRSLDLVVALLAVLKAGGAYVPIDPSYPQERVAFILGDAAPVVVLTQASLRAMLPETAAHVVRLDADAAAIAVQPVTPPVSGVELRQLAYLIYTSGTTGTPKAVLVEHGQLLQVLHASQTTFGYQATDVQPWLASVAFDIAAFELFNPLLVGGTVVIQTQAQILDLPQLVRDLQDWTLLHAVPSLLRQIVNQAKQTGTPAAYAGLRRIWVGGDAVPPELLADTLAVFPQAELVVLYGPTEGTIICACHVVDPQHVPTRQLIGRPLPNAQLRLYDAHGQLVPVGVAGELYIGGGSVTRGYLNRPELTAEKFVTIDNQRWYRSGDRARYLPDGTLEFLGRTDAQVKIRGYRIEVGEVEAVLAQHEGVREAVVLARADNGSDLRLVAYIVEEQGNKGTKEQPTDSFPSPAATEAEASRGSGKGKERSDSEGLVPSIRQFLLDKLPPYMVPSAFVVLESLPLSANGKVDRKALPAPEQTSRAAGAAYVAPQSEAERILSEIWATVLRLEQVGIHDNFFSLGGDSILSIQVIARATQAGLRLTPKQIFQHQTIAELAAVADTTALVVAEQGLVTGAVPLTPIQQHFFAQTLPTPHHFNQAVLLQAGERLDPVVLEQALQQLLQHHDALRLRFYSTESGWIQEHAAPDEQPVLMRIDLQTIPAAEQAAALEAAATEIQASLNLQTGPILRAALFELGAQQPQRLLVVVHHLAVDAVSWPILLEDLESAYSQARSGTTIALPPKTTAFKQWAERLRTYAASPDLLAELPFWQFVAQQPVVALPVDIPTGANLLTTGATVTVRLSAEETRELLHEVPNAYQTQITEVLLTALALTINGWTGGMSLRLDLEGHGREDLFADVDLSRTVGWFTALYPVLLELEPMAEPGSAIKAIKEQVRQVPQRGIGYGLLRYLNHDQETESLRAMPAAEINFNYLGQVDRGAATSGVFSAAQGSVGATQSPDSPRRYLLEITALIHEGALQLSWMYSQAIHQRATIEGIAQEYIATLQSLIAHCLAPDAGGFTPSDFPEMDFDQDELDDLLEELSGTIEE